MQRHAPRCTPQFEFAIRKGHEEGNVPMGAMAEKKRMGPNGLPSRIVGKLTRGRLRLRAGFPSMREWHSKVGGAKERVVEKSLQKSHSESTQNSTGKTTNKI